VLDRSLWSIPDRGVLVTAAAVLFAGRRSYAQARWLEVTVVGSVLERIGIVATAFIAFLALFPYYGADTDPPQHFSVFDNRVPAGPDGGPWLAAGVGLTTLVVLELVRRRAHRSSKT